MNRILLLLKEETGADLAEYALVMLFIALAVIAGVQPFANQLFRTYNVWQTQVDMANPDIH